MFLLVESASMADLRNMPQSGRIEGRVNRNCRSGLNLTVKSGKLSIVTSFEIERR
jgi:hypothetical protein